MLRIYVLGKNLLGSTPGSHPPSFLVYTRRKFLYRDPDVVVFDAVMLNHTDCKFLSCPKSLPYDRLRRRKRRPVDMPSFPRTSESTLGAQSVCLLLRRRPFIPSRTRKLCRSASTLMHGPSPSSASKDCSRNVVCTHSTSGFHAQTLSFLSAIGGRSLSTSFFYAPCSAQPINAVQTSKEPPDNVGVRLNGGAFSEVEKSGHFMQCGK